MRISENGINLIKKFEGLRLSSYLDAVGIATIGYGHVINENSEKYLLNTTITESKAEEILKNDVSKWEKYINQTCEYYGAKLNQNQFDALCSFCFNLGCFSSDMKEHFKNKDLKAVGNAIPLYNKAKGRVLGGLTVRREAEKELYFS